MRSAKGLTILAAASTGALLAYLLDPTQGKRRRALVRDKAYSQLKSVQDCAPGIVADVRNRAQGLASRLRLRLARAEVPDDILIERVRARIGREVAHPGSIGVSAASGEVTLTGVALESERQRLIGAVRRVPGVARVLCEVQVHPVAGKVPGLQG